MDANPKPQASVRLDDAGTKGSSSPDKPAAAHVPDPPVPIRALFRFATCSDYVVLLVGSFAAIGVGSAMAAFVIIFSNVLNQLNSTTPSSAESTSLIFVYVGVGLFFAGFVQIAAFVYVSERLTVKLRMHYMRAILDQDIEFFDDVGAATLGSRVAEATIAYRDALGEKLGQLLQFAAMFIAGLVVGFVLQPYVALVVLAITPFLGFGGYFMATTLSKIVSGQLDTYAIAGGIAEETFALIRTVTSLGIQERRIAKYDHELSKTVEDYRKMGVSLGLGFGFV